MKVKQWNGGRGKEATRAALEKARGEGVDILLIQEPYVRKGKIEGVFGRIYGKVEDEELWAAIVIINNEWKAMLEVDVSNKEMACVKVKKGEEEVRFASVYCRPSISMELSIRKLERIVRKDMEVKLVLAMDVNGRSWLWNSGEENDRGRQMEEFLNTWNLKVLNVVTELTTFEDSRGRGANIDVTAVRGYGEEVEWRWKVEDEELSDHRAIVVEMRRKDRRRNVERNVLSEGRFDLRKANWDGLEKYVKRKLSHEGEDELRGVEEKAERLQKIVVEGCREYIPRIKSGENVKCVGWWNKNIEDKKKEMRRKRRRWVRYRSDEDGILFRRARTEYLNLIRKAKIENWKKKIENMNKEDPYGEVYKVLRGKNKKRTILSNIKRPDGSYTSTVEETVDYIMSELLPDDDREGEIEVHRRMREEVESYLEVGEAEQEMERVEMREEEVRQAIRKIRNNKAPGCDGIRGEIVKRLEGVIWKELKEIAEGVMNEGKFPMIWKKGMVKIFLKDEKMDGSEVKMYRPVTLLPVMGKVIERLVAIKLKEEVDNKISGRQFGFMQGRSTRMALEQAREDVEEADGVVVGIFADISGAFDNAWFVAILKQMIEWDCSRKMVKTIESYLEGRSVEMEVDGVKRRKRITKGCPQGSILGPLLWNVLFDSLLARNWGIGISIVAYADDALVIVEGSTRREIEGRLGTVVEDLWRWAKERKLKMSEKKTVAMKLKGRRIGRRGTRRDETRKYVIRNGEVKLKTVREVRYLGVEISERMRYEGHLQKMNGRVMEVFMALRRNMKADGGITFEIMKTLYRGVAEPMMLYGVELWGEQVERVERFGEEWNKLQRKILLVLTMAYRTVSTEALWLVAGIEPLDLKIKERYRISRDIKEGRIKEESEAFRKAEMLIEWQRRWDLCMKGRVTYSMCNNVDERLKKNWKIGYYETQGLTGHGNFKAKLQGLGLVEQAECVRCGILEDVVHVMMECELYENERMELRRKAEEAGIEWEIKNMLRDELRNEYLKTTRKIGKKKKELEEI